MKRGGIRLLIKTLLGKQSTTPKECAVAAAADSLQTTTREFARDASDMRNTMLQRMLDLTNKQMEGRHDV